MSKKQSIYAVEILSIVLFRHTCIQSAQQTSISALPSNHIVLSAECELRGFSIETKQRSE